MSPHMKVLPALAALVAAAACAASAYAESTALPTIHVTYAMNCTFTVTDDNGARVTSIAPGTYGVLVTTPVPFEAYSNGQDMTACRGFVQFQLSGPGVNVFTNLTDGGETSSNTKVTFQPSSTYTAVDINQPSVARAAFTTAASGTPIAPPDNGSSATSSQGKAPPPPKIPFRGALDAIVYSAKKLTLTRNGKKVISLKTGQYTFSVDDESRKAGFSVQVLRGKAQTVTSAAYMGSHDVTLTLKPGRWTFFTPGGTKNVFFVVT